MKTSRSIENLVSEILRQKDIKEDYVVGSQFLRMEAWDSELFLRVLDADGNDRLEPLMITDTAHRQIGARLGIPAKYYSTMFDECKELLTQNVNFRLRLNPEQRMLRVMDGRVRAFLSNRYLRIDHYEVACTVLPAMTKVKDLRFISNHINEDRLYIKATHPTLVSKVTPDITAQAGIMVCNSETGLGTFYVSPMIYCPELKVAMISDSGKVKRTHAGPVYRTEEHFQLRPEQFLTLEDNEFAERIRLSVDEAWNEESFNDTVNGMREALSAVITAAEPAALVHEAASAFAMTESEEEGVLTLLNAENDMTRFGVACAITRQSEMAESYERATELEEISYRMLTMPAKQWERMNRAAA